MRRSGENLSIASLFASEPQISAFCQIKNLTSHEARPEELLYTRLENKLQRELQDAWVVRSIGLKQSVAEAARIAG